MLYICNTPQFSKLCQYIIICEAECIKHKALNFNCFDGNPFQTKFLKKENVGHNINFHCNFVLLL